MTITYPLSNSNNFHFLLKLHVEKSPFHLLLCIFFFPISKMNPALFSFPLSFLSSFSSINLTKKWDTVDVYFVDRHRHAHSGTKERIKYHSHEFKSQSELMPGEKGLTIHLRFSSLHPDFQFIHKIRSAKKKKKLICQEKSMIKEYWFNV